MPYQPIENYGVIGNMRTVALVGLNGSIDWFCFPHFDSPSVFGALLDSEKGGHFSISSLNSETRCRQFYWPETNVLMTRFLSADGVGEIQDFMPAGAEEPWPHQLVRRVRCTRGTLKLRAECFPMFDYARLAPEVELRDDRVVFRGGDLALELASVPLRRDKRGVTAEFTLRENESALFVLRRAESGGDCPRQDLRATHDPRLERGATRLRPALRKRFAGRLHFAHASGLLPFA